MSDVKSDYKPTLLLDFDGVIHRYSKGWQDGTIYDDVTYGFFPWAEKACRRFKLLVYSSRSATQEGRAAMELWFAKQEAKWKAEGNRYEDKGFQIQFVANKPPAFLTIDDRGLTFNGNWDDFHPDELIAFRPWNVGD